MNETLSKFTGLLHSYNTFVAACARVGKLGKDGLYDLDRAHPLLHVGCNCFTITCLQVIEPWLSS